MMTMTSSITSPLKLLVLASAAVATFGLVACGSSGGGSVAKTTPSVSASPSASGTPAAGVAKSGGTGTTDSTSIGGATGSGTTGTSGPSLSVNVTTEPLCASGTNLHSVMGVQPVIAWSSTGTTNVKLAIDGPGLYGTFPPSGSDELPFGGCSGPDGSTVSHTYTFTTIHGGVSRTVTLTATAHTITQVGTGNQPTPTPTPTPTITP